VFISYAQESDEHKGQVRAMCEVLAGRGMDLIFDQWVRERVIWPEWAEAGARNADYVLVVASQTYRDRVDKDRVLDQGSGALYEARILRELVNKHPDSAQRKILPIILPGQEVDSIPFFLLPTSATYYPVGRIDEHGLREVLGVLTGTPVRRHSPVILPARPRVPVTRSRPAVPATAPWTGGDEVAIGDGRYLVHDEPLEWHGSDHAVVWRTATARRVDARHGLVRLRQVRTVTPHVAAGDRRAGLRAQAALAGSELVDLVDDDAATTVVTARPPGRPWSEVLGPGERPLDMPATVAALRAAASLCDRLARLHAAGSSHRGIGPGEVLLPGGAGPVRLRDLGFAGLTPSSDDRPPGHRAPEQSRPPYAAGSRTDLYQVAALVQHTVAGVPPVPVVLPLRTLVPACPAGLDRLLQRCLDPDPAQRPGDATVLATALRAAAMAIADGAGRQVGSA
jgi:hypothetical protein